MSYDMSIGEEEFNITYNVGPMFYACFPGKGIRFHYDMTGRKAVHPLRVLREYLEDHRDHLLTLEPQNGWGSYEGALQFVTDLIGASLRNPDLVWQGD